MENPATDEVRLVIQFLKRLQFLPYGRSIGSLMSYTQDVYMSHGTENYVQQRKTYTTKAAKVHLNCYSVITLT
jgi:hypothetical protein